MSAGSVVAARPAYQRAGGGAIPTPALQSLRVRPISHRAAKGLLLRNHYLHTMPGGTRLAFGVFSGDRLMGAATLGVGPFNVHRLVAGATREDCLVLTRLWLADDLPKNSESRALAVILRSLARDTSVKFLVTYADPTVGHVGIIYQATGWLYTGMSEPSVLYDIGDGVLRNSRTLGHAYGTRSSRYFSEHGVELKGLRQEAKHRYSYFLNSKWRKRLRVPVQPYPKKSQIESRIQENDL
uniref:DNA modification protein n=1 Tax=uncultured marine microorganism HF4000_005H07 TaxID=455506 RepID=B3T0C8_9ZZZZ|nr:hypothetical protein ALOHA_HF4000005H07ctg1g5 [uncultured marine microorganism HF4000_005H07]